MSSDSQRFMPKNISPHAIVSHLQNELRENNIANIYMVIKDSKGNFNEIICGETGDLAFAILVLQKYWMDNI